MSDEFTSVIRISPRTGETKIDPKRELEVLDAAAEMLEAEGMSYVDARRLAKRILELRKR